MNIDYEKIHFACGWHEQAVLNSKICGCFYCIKIFTPNEIIEWVEEDPRGKRGPGKTAICPYCGIDSVLPDNIGHELTSNFLKKMNEEYF